MKMLADFADEGFRQKVKDVKRVMLQSCFTFFVSVAHTSPALLDTSNKGAKSVRGF